MDVFSVQGDAFSAYYLKRLLPNEPKLLPRLDSAGANKAFRTASQLFRHSQRELRGTRQTSRDSPGSGRASCTATRLAARRG